MGVTKWLTQACTIPEINPICYPNCCDCCLLFPLNHQLHLTEVQHHVLLQHLATNLVLLARMALWKLITVPAISTRIPLGCMGLWSEKGVGASAGVAGRTGGGGLLLHRCACCSLVDGNKRNGRGCCSGRHSLRNTRRHGRLLLVLVGAPSEVGVLSNSDEEGFFVPGARAAATAATAHPGAALSAAIARAVAARFQQRNELTIMVSNPP